MCRAHRIIIAVAITAWIVVVVMLLCSPGPSSMWRLPFFVLLTVAVSLLSLALLPWLLLGLLPLLLGPLEPLLRDYVGTFLAGWTSREALEEPDGGPGLHLVRGGAS